MKHEMNTLAIGRQGAFSTMVSNKMPATAHCLSDGIHKAKERTKEEDRRGEGCGERKVKTKLSGKHQEEMEVWRKRALALVIGAFFK